MADLAERSVVVVSDGLELDAGAWLPRDPAGTVLLLHGIPSSAPPDPSDEGYPGLARRFAARGWAAVWVRMRGSGRGFFSIEGWVADARAAMESARRLDGVADGPLAVVGSSAGGAVAVEAAARWGGIDALVLLGCPAAWVTFATGAEDAVRVVTQEAGMELAPEVLAQPGSWMREFDSVIPEASIARVTAPLLIVHGDADDVVPVEHARRLARAAPRCELMILEGAGHRLRRDEVALQRTIGWIDGTLR